MIQRGKLPARECYSGAVPRYQIRESDVESYLRAREKIKLDNLDRLDKPALSVGGESA